MKRTQVYAVGRDQDWLKAVAAIADDIIAVKVVHCLKDPVECLSRLSPPQPGALVLLDATGLADVSGAVRRLRGQGWRYGAVVAADPSWREARSVFLAAREYDYWGKTNTSAVIRRQILQYLEAMQQGEGTPAGQGAC